MDRRLTVASVSSASSSTSQTTKSRKTREGRTITYKLTVLQQPERARACGSGAKSSADRRPVDPPPIVELRIYEGDNDQNLKDITFQMSANYFLFTTLEPAKKIAQPRGQQDNRACVLTGTPVAGMVYLDRPNQAGYFIFPDLSVRHEGQYQLSFNLYEELKEPKDGDCRDETGVRPTVEAHVTHRMEVKSDVFRVFSAKRFPGLATSTVLSRTVAEQGCRVRIRRDARIRKREPRSSKDGYGDEDAEPHRATTAEIYDSGIHDSRARSDSIASHGSRASQAQQELNQAYQQQPGYAPVPGSQPPLTVYHQAPYGHPSAPQYLPQYHTPLHQGQPSAMPPPPPQYQHHNGYPQPVPTAHHHQGYYGYVPAPPHHVGVPQAYDSANHARTNSFDMHAQSAHDRSQPAYIRPTVPQAPGYGSQPPAYSTSSSYGGPPSARETHREAPPSVASSAPGPMTQTMKLPPINTSIPVTRDPRLEPSPVSAGPYSSYEAYNRSSHPAPYPQPTEPSPNLGSKRSFDSSFTQYPETLRNHARPSNAHHEFGRPSFENGQTGAFEYKRANGELHTRVPPSVCK